MLDLKTRVHFEEVETLVLPCDELHRARRIVVHGLGQCDGLLAHLAAGSFIEQRAWGFLDDLLVAALDRAFTLAEIDHVAMLVAEHLNFDVARIDDELFNENAVVTERGFCLRLCEVEAFFDFGLRVRNAHALAAAACGGLDHDRIADLVGDLHGMLAVLDHTEIARHRRNLGLRRGLFRFDLVTHRGNRVRVRSNEDDPGGRQCTRKRLALRKKAITRMHSLGAGLAAGFDDLVHDKIALGGLRWTDVNRLVRHFHVQGIAIGIGIDGHRLDAHPARGLDDPASDFAAIGDQYLFEHGMIWTFRKRRVQAGRPEPQFGMRRRL